MRITRTFTIIEDMNTAARNRSGGGPDAAETLKDFWISRPRRTQRGRKVAGVAAGIGARYEIDPVIVRVALVVATVLGGFGVLLYLLGWLLLPDERDEVSALESLFGKGHSSTPPHVAIGLSIGAFLSLGWVFNGWWFQGTGIAVTALAVIGLLMLHHSRGDKNRPRVPAPGHAAPASFSAQQTSLSPEESTESNYQPPPGVWDPLGADPLGWQFSDDPATAERPEPTRAAQPGTSPSLPPAPRRRSAGPAITAGATLLTAGVGAALAMLGVPWFTLGNVIGMTLAVLGIGMVFSSFAGSGRGLLGLAVPLSAAGLVVTMLPTSGLPSGGFGPLDARPASAAEVLDVYERTGGSITVDLTGLPADSEPVNTRVSLGMGKARVILPESADVTLTCANSVGGIECLGRTARGVGVDDVSLTEEGIGDGPKITLEVSSVMGDVEVTRGR